MDVKPDQNAPVLGNPNLACVRQDGVHPSFHLFDRRLANQAMCLQSYRVEASWHIVPYEVRRPAKDRYHIGFAHAVSNSANRSMVDACAQRQARPTGDGAHSGQHDQKPDRQQGSRAY